MPKKSKKSNKYSEKPNSATIVPAIPQIIAIILKVYPVFTVEKVKTVEYKLDAFPTQVETNKRINAGNTKSKLFMIFIISTSPVWIDGIALKSNATGNPMVLLKNIF